MSIIYTALPTSLARAYQQGGKDAHDQTPEQALSSGSGVPCRHCLRQVPAGQTYLILAHRPFPALQPYAETGPIFLCAAPCARGAETEFPPMLAAPTYLLRGYDSADRIVYGSGAVVVTAEIPQEAEARFNDSRICYLHLRSAQNNCYQLRIDRA